jgi:hypothetical protein
LWVGDVSGDGMRRAAARYDAGRDCFNFSTRARDQSDVRAFRSQTFGNRTTDAATGARNQCC